MKVFKFVVFYVLCVLVMYTRLGFSFTELPIQLRIGDLNYAATALNENAQSLPIPTRIHEIIYPTLGFPSLVMRGQTFSIILDLPQEKLDVLKTTPLSSLSFVINLSPYFGRDVERALPGGFEKYYSNYFDLVEHVPTGQTYFLPMIYFKRWTPRHMGFVIQASSENFEFLDHKVILTVRLPSDLPDYTNRALDLEVQILKDKKLIVHDIQRHCVGLLQKKDKYRFIHFADPQINNLDLNLRGQLFKHHADLSNQEFALYQAIQEMNFLNPDFAIVSGDIVDGGNTYYNAGQMGALFSGMDMIFEPYSKSTPYHLESSSYWNEFQSIIQFFRQLKFPTFIGPGNHDGYAAYEKQNVSNTLPDIKFTPTITGPEEQRVLFDGKHYWQKMLGPRYYSFDFGIWHFVFLDTFDHYRYFRLTYSNFGTNDGGWISEQQLQWLETDLRAAEKAGKKIVLVGHHDPRGGAKGMFYDDPHYRYPRRGLLRLGDELWYKFNNFQKDPLFSCQQWASADTPVDHHGLIDTHYDSARELLRLIATYPVTHFFLGHDHADYYDLVTIGNHRVHFVHTTALSAQAFRARDMEGYKRAEGEGEAPEAHWGYRVFDLDLAGHMEEIYPIELGNIRLNIGHQEDYRRQEKGLFSKWRPWPTWLPLHELLTKLETKRILPSILSDVDPILSMSALLDPKIQPLTFQLIHLTDWPQDLITLFSEKMDHQYAKMYELLGTPEKPNQIFLFNGNPFEIDGLLEFPIARNLSTSLLTKRIMIDDAKDAQIFSLEENPLSTRTIETVGGRWGQFQIILPKKGEIPVYLKIEL